QAALAVGLLARRGLGVSVVEAVVHNVGEQRHGRVRAWRPRRCAPNGGLLRHAGYRRTSRPVPPNVPGRVPDRPPWGGLSGTHASRRLSAPAGRRPVTPGPAGGRGPSSVPRCPRRRTTRRAAPGRRRRRGLPPTGG